MCVVKSVSLVKMAQSGDNKESGDNKDSKDSKDSKVLLFHYNTNTNVLTPQNASAARVLVERSTGQSVVPHEPTLRVKQIANVLNHYDPMSIVQYGDDYLTFAGLLEPELKDCVTEQQTLVAVRKFFSAGIGGAPYTISSKCGSAIWSVIQ